MLAQQSAITAAHEVWVHGELDLNHYEAEPFRREDTVRESVRIVRGFWENYYADRPGAAVVAGLIQRRVDAELAATH